MVTKSKNPIVACTAGGIAGGLEATAVWPMEYIKTQLQLQASKARASGEKPAFDSILGGLKYQYQRAGFTGLYRGLGPVVTFSIPKAGVRFGCFSVISERLREGNETLGPMKNLAAGVGAGVSEAILAVTPIETVKTKLIDGDKTFMQGVKEIISKEGPRGFYKGLIPTIGKQASNQGIRFMIVGEYKTWLTKDREDKSVSAVEGLLGGMIAGCSSTIANNPLDAVKTRMQGLEAHKYNGTADCVKKMFEEGGIKSFYRGTIARMGRVVPGQGLIFGSYEAIQNQVVRVTGLEQ
jgi:solute carrier family 25 (mitochondrial citrate transporter), member 1